MNPLRLDEPEAELAERRTSRPSTCRPSAITINMEAEAGGGLQHCHPALLFALRLAVERKMRWPSGIYAGQTQHIPESLSHIFRKCDIGPSCQRGRYNLHLMDNLSPPTYYLCELLKKHPGLVRGKRLRCLPSRRCRSMPSIKRNPSNWKSFRTTLILSLDQGPRTSSRIHCCLPGAAIVGHKCIPQLLPTCNRNRPITRPMLTIKRDRIPSAITSRQSCPRNDCHRAELLRTGARDGIAHRSAVAEASREAEVLVDAELGLDFFDHLIDEYDVLAAGVRPSAVQPLGGNGEGTDGVSAGERRKTHEGQEALLTVG